MQLANLALKFLLEVVGLASVAYWAFTIADQLPARLVLAVTAAALFIGVWGVFLAPTASSGLSQAQKNVLGGLVLLIAAAALGAAGQSTAALVYGAAVIVNAGLLLVLGDDPGRWFAAGPRA
jgi:Protein of unknown function (DUF2568)